MKDKVLKMTDSAVNSTTYRPVSMPNRHVIAVFTFAILLPLVYYIPPWLMRNVSDNHLLVTVLALIIIVPVISYVALPLLFRAFSIYAEKLALSKV